MKADKKGWKNQLGGTEIGEPITIGKDTEVSRLDSKPYWLIPKSLNMKAMMDLSKYFAATKIADTDTEGKEIIPEGGMTEDQWEGSALMLYYGVHDHNLDNDNGEKEEWTPDVAKEVLERTMAGCTQVIQEVQKLSAPLQKTKSGKSNG